jgi:MoxR-like ATPase
VIDEMISIRGKRVLTFPSYIPTFNDNEGIIGREQELRLIQAAWIAQPGCSPMHPLLVGEPGVGKNRLVYELARITGKALYIFQAHDEAFPEDPFCAVRASDEVDRKIDYVLQSLATAMRQGGIGFIDEIGKLPHRAFAPLSSLLDERRYVDSNSLGERIEAHPGFRFIAATNSADLTRNGLPDFVQSRQRLTIPIGYPPRDEITRIIRSRFRRIGEDNEALIAQFWRLWSEARGDEPVTPRDALYLFGLTSKLADLDAAGGRWVEQSARPFVTPETKHLEEAFRSLFLQANHATGGHL